MTATPQPATSVSQQDAMAATSTSPPPMAQSDTSPSPSPSPAIQSDTSPSPSPMIQSDAVSISQANAYTPSPQSSTPVAFDQSTTALMSQVTSDTMMYATPMSSPLMTSPTSQVVGGTTAFAAAFSSFGMSSVQMFTSQSPLVLATSNGAQSVFFSSSSPLAASGSSAASGTPPTSDSHAASDSSAASGTSSLSPSLLSPSATTVSPPSASSSSKSNTNNTTAAALASPSHSAMFWVGIVFAVIVALACIAAFLAWSIRIRTRSKRHAIENSTFWPWDRNRNNSFVSDNGHLETGGDGPGDIETKHPWAQSEKRRTLPRSLNLGDPDILTAQETDVLGDSSFMPRPPASVYLQHHLVGPYPTIPVNEATQSVPDLAPDLGSLQVTNLMPGDVPSCDLSSRFGDEPNFSPELGASNLQFKNGVSHFQPANEAGRGAHGTPFRPGPMLADSPASDWPTPLAPVENPTEEDITEREGWASSLKTNLFSAFNAVVKGGGAEDPFGDNFTRPPLRRERSRRSNPTPTTLNMSREKMVPSFASMRNDSMLEDIEEALDDGTQARAPGPPRPPPAMLSRDRIESDWVQPESMGRTTSEQSRASTAQLGYLADTPHMPEDSPRSDVAYGHITSQKALHADMPSRDKMHGYRRPALTAQQSSSAVSMASDLSRESSERLSTQEQFAKKVFMERRRRVLQMEADRRTQTVQEQSPGDDTSTWPSNRSNYAPDVAVDHFI